MTPVLSQRRRADRAFERMYNRHVLDVYRYSLVVLPSPQDAEDVTQTTFLNAYRAFKGGERPRAQRNWLMGLAHEICRQRFRQTTRGNDQVELHDAGAAAVQDEHEPTAHDIRRALARLDFNERAALVMREVEARPYQEIAEVLERSVSDVETLVFRARRALREELEGSFTCNEAERAVSRKLDGLLQRAERDSLRQHLRECEDCSDFSRRQDSQRTALLRYAMVPLPSSLASFFTTRAGDEESTGGGSKFSATSESV